MNFSRELAEVRAFLVPQGFRMAVIGGVALAAYGNPRMTLDLDIVTDAAPQEEARGYFARAGLEEKWRELERGL